MLVLWPQQNYYAHPKCKKLLPTVKQLPKTWLSQRKYQGELRQGKWREKKTLNVQNFNNSKPNDYSTRLYYEEGSKNQYSISVVVGFSFHKMSKRVSVFTGWTIVKDPTQER